MPGVPLRWAALEEPERLAFELPRSVEGSAERRACLLSATV